MVKVKVLKFDVNTRTQEITEQEQPETPINPPQPTPKGLDFEKLKQVLKQKGIINDYSEVE
jgi:hypothetical protein